MWQPASALPFFFGGRNAGFQGFLESPPTPGFHQDGAL
jgi:hypothetical protein